MSSISLPRVLQPRRTNSLDVERENFEKAQALSISKAVNNQESPAKEKHVRNAIIGTFTEKGATIFWSVVTKLPLQGNPIVCWKFCHTLHKVLREGHQNSINESMKYKSIIEDLGKLWGHLKEGYGKLISCYSRLLIVKLEFHKRNPQFPGNMQLTREQLEDIGERDVNNYFQITVEMFDYMDEILNLQLAVFGSLDMSRSNSMTNSGQCRLAPLIPCIQDSSQLYDYCVKLLFKLHSSLSPDILIGHSDRFRKQFHQLRQFYLSSSTLQYFKHLIQIPLLPENPPNFLVQSDLSTHVSPVVILPPQADTPDNDSVDMSLIDTTSLDLLSADDSHQSNGSISPEQMSEKDRLIEQLLREIDDLRMEIQRIKIEDQRAIDDLNRQIMVLESQIAELTRHMHQKMEETDHLQKQVADSVQNSEAVVKLTEAEKKAKGSEEKFQKMKDVYNKLREEHITLIRTKAEVDKQLTLTAKSSEEVQKVKSDMEEMLLKAMLEKRVTEEVMQQSSNETCQQLAQALSINEEVERKKQEMEERLQMVIGEKASLEDQIQSLLKNQAELTERLSSIEQLRRETEQRLQLLGKDAQFRLLVSCVEEAEFIVQTSLDEFDNPGFAPITCTPEYLLSISDPVLQYLDKLTAGHEKFALDSENMEDLLRAVGVFGHLLSQFVLDGKATSNSSPDIEQGEKLAKICREAGQETLTLFRSLKSNESQSKVTECAAAVRSHVEAVMVLTGALGSLMTQSDEVGDLVEQELQGMDSAIEEAVRRFEDLLERSREADSGMKLEVSSKILDTCNALIQTIRVLVQRSKDLQAEIVVQGRGTASAKEFYKRNHRWTEGLISAAKAVGLGATFLVDAADKVVSGNAKFEELMVASQEIAASTAQLVVASKVKAERGSENLTRLSQASRGVTDATGNVVATARSCAQMLEDSDVMDFTKLTLHQAKRLEMDSQVRVLELENQLTKERMKLSGLRKQHYTLAGASEGWDEEDIPK